LTILINLSSDEEVLKVLAEDDEFIETLLFKLTVRLYPRPAAHSHNH
jgi:hypothetical protein